jgi:hypothetical protein
MESQDAKFGKMERNILIRSEKKPEKKPEKKIKKNKKKMNNFVCF